MTEDLLAKIEQGRCSIRIRALAMKEIYNADSFDPFFEGADALSGFPLNRG